MWDFFLAPWRWSPSMSQNNLVEMNSEILQLRTDVATLRGELGDTERDLDLAHDCVNMLIHRVEELEGKWR